MVNFLSHPTLQGILISALCFLVYALIRVHTRNSQNLTRQEWLQRCRELNIGVGKSKQDNAKAATVGN